MPNTRCLPIGAEITLQGVHFRVWAPKAKKVEFVLNSATGHVSFDLGKEDKGYFSGFVKEASDGTLYQFRLDGHEDLYPDPASRYQPQGPHGPSQIIDP